MTFGSLFAGIGGFDLGFERAGLKCVWQVELDPFCRKVLAKHWPNVPRWDDVRTFTGEGFERPDVICGGFPCQDISVAGRGAGIDGDQSGLWAEYARVIRVVRPRFVVVENSPALLGRGIDRVLGDLAACGFDSEWDCLPAFAAGAHHERDRLFIIAYSNGHDGRKGRTRRPDPSASRQSVTERPLQERTDSDDDRERCEELDFPPPLPIAARKPDRPYDAIRPRVYPASIPQGDDGGRQSATEGEGRVPILGIGCSGSWRSWSAEPAVGRVADGVPNRVDRLRGLGNAVVPQVAEFIGRQLLAAISHTRPQSPTK
jgi:DNA (cytosine-5)-methyltransferase 1